MWCAEKQLNKPADNAFTEHNVILTTRILIEVVLLLQVILFFIINIKHSREHLYINNNS